VTEPARRETHFLSREWLAELSRSLVERWPGAEGPEAPEASEGPEGPEGPEDSEGLGVSADREGPEEFDGRTRHRLALGELVTSGPNGDVEYTIVFAPDRPPRLLEGTVAGADVVLVQTFDTARRIAEGEISPAQALSSGLIRLRGDALALVRGGDLLGALHPAPPAGSGTAT
jgi:hypothetical protein